MKKKVCLLIQSIVLFSILQFMAVYAQAVPGVLMISKVYVESKNGELWIEIYNPENISLKLTSMRISGIRSLNLLPEEFKGQQFIEIKANERFIICSDIKSFRTRYGKEIRAVEQPLLKNILYGGFIAINNRSVFGSSKNVVRIGRSEMSQSIASKAPDSEPVEVTAEGTCYTREVTANGILSSWKKNIPNPGKK